MDHAGIDLEETIELLPWLYAESQKTGFELYLCIGIKMVKISFDPSPVSITQNFSTIIVLKSAILLLRISPLLSS
jgi:hypothetical protein